MKHGWSVRRLCDAGRTPENSSLDSAAPQRRKGGDEYGAHNGTWERRAVGLLQAPLELAQGSECTSGEWHERELETHQENIEGEEYDTAHQSTHDPRSEERRRTRRQRVQRESRRDGFETSSAPYRGRLPKLFRVAFAIINDRAMTRTHTTVSPPSGGCRGTHPAHWRHEARRFLGRRVD